MFTTGRRGRPAAGLSATLRALLAAAALLCLLAPAVAAANVTVLCKCDCAPNSAILSVPSCAGCTKAFCVESLVCSLPPGSGATPSSSADLPTSTWTGTSPLAGPTAATHGDETWTAVCFQRGSYKDEIIVYFFIIVTSTLVAFALAKPFIANYFRESQIQLPAYRTLLDDE
ncbi:hypothetical protein HK105_205494 [Polyrhizophydium stewartii]|uniref:Uncharacterized protein n=1 Tax=Polyrhizophydium stewartii TaxID=2732419 RepID=A0ABR4N5Y7_9FUNG|nr:hypothetical protein HK105_003178 [Polyrhizophydium stewartii]